MPNIFKRWWRGLIYEPLDPRFLAGKNIKIAVLGGGSGLAVLLSGLKKYSNDISAIVSVMDDGKSSGRIRKKFDILPPGDIRKCIVALSKYEGDAKDFFNYRFPEGTGAFAGHTLGNIWLAGLAGHIGSFEKAVQATTEIFVSAGKILPATLEKLELIARYDDGKVVRGESRIPRPKKRIKSIKLSNEGAKAYRKSVEALKSANLIVIGPGSLYTSIIPNLLIADINRAIAGNTSAVRIFIINSSTERGETENYSAEDHIFAIKDHSKNRLFDYCLVNDKIVKKSKDESLLGGVHNITTDREEILGCKIYKEDIIDPKKPLYHQPDKLAKAIIKIYNSVKK